MGQRMNQRDKSPTMAVLGHPGHELVILQTLDDLEAEVNCLTDGSGGNRENRVNFTLETLQRINAKSGPVMGAYPDKAFYADLISGDTGHMELIAQNLVERALHLRPQVVIADGFEYYNPMHDMANTLADIIVTTLTKAGLKTVKCSFPIEYADRISAAPVFRMRQLISAEAKRKTEAALSYKPLLHEYESLPEAKRNAMVLSETLYEDPIRLANIPDASDAGYSAVLYEESGRKRQASGLYNDVITLDRHYRPFVRSLVSAMI